MAMKNYTNNVFINCPFDDAFDDMFHAMVFAIFDCGFIARCAKEESNSADVRIEKIINIIKQSKYGIHDISRTELCTKTKLPRFNMPLELGIFLGARKYGDSKQKQKVCLILDKSAHRYEKYISDIKGQDISAHSNKITKSVELVSNWLRNCTRRRTIPGGKEISRRYKLFSKELPDICKESKIQTNELGFNDYSGFVSEWIRQNPTA
jgi:hypothetical protein